MVAKPSSDKPDPDKPNSDKTDPDDASYKAWLADRRAAKPTSALPDQVMHALQHLERSEVHYVRLADRMNQSRPARWAACFAALVVGSLPFLLVARFAELLVF